MKRFVFVCVLVTNSVQAGSVRSVIADSAGMIPIFLSLGKSTVLHFSEKPTKIICGNQNYLNIEFTGNDVTIQPLGPVHTNLFVYSKSHRYGFLVTVRGKGSYDDLVKVKWGEPQAGDPRELKEELYSIAPSVTVGTLAKCSLIGARYDLERGMHILDLVIKNLAKTPQKPSRKWFSLRDDSGHIKIAAIAFKNKEQLQPEGSIRVRVLFKYPETEGFELWFQMEGFAKKMPIQFDKSRL